MECEFSPLHGVSDRRTLYREQQQRAGYKTAATNYKSLKSMAEERKSRS